MGKPQRIGVRPITRRLAVALSVAEREALDPVIEASYNRLNFAEQRLREDTLEIQKRHREELRVKLKEQRDEVSAARRAKAEAEHKKYMGTENRDVPCQERLDYEKGEVTVVRMDTLDILERRGMTREERQLEIDGFPGSA